MELSERIAKWRQVKGVSQQELAHSLGVTPAAVYQWEAGTTKPSTTNLEALVEALGLTMVKFYGRVPRRAA